METLWQTLTWKFSIIFGLSAAIIALFQAIFNTIQKLKENRWNKAKLAYDMLEELFDFEPAFKALDIIDPFVNCYTKKNIKITPNLIEKALNFNEIEMSESSEEIRVCFDALFYYLERMEHSIEIKVIDFKDIESHFKYYSDLLLKNKSTIIDYSNGIGYKKVEKFLLRFNIK